MEYKAWSHKQKQKDKGDCHLRDEDLETGAHTRKTKEEEVPAEKLTSFVNT